jgi:hypothetical protein
LDRAQVAEADFFPASAFGAISRVKREGIMSLLKWTGLALCLNSSICLAAETAEVPFELVNGLVYVQTTVNGSTPLPFVLDTGASYTVLSPETAKGLGIVATGSIKTDGPGRGDEVAMKIATGVGIRLGGEELADQQVAVLPVDYISRQANHATAGILSVNTFAGRVVQVDYAAKVIRIYDPATFSPSPDDIPIPLTISDNVPFVQAEVGLPNNRSLKGSFVLDSGLVGAIVFSKPLLSRHPELRRINGLIDLPPVEAVGGTMHLQAAPIPFLRLGTFTINSPVAVFSIDGAGVLDNQQIDGIIGADILMPFCVTYDYAHHQMFLAPASTLAPDPN